MASVTYSTNFLPAYYRKVHWPKTKILPEFLFRELPSPHGILQLGNKRFQMPVNTPMPVRMVNINRLTITARTHLNPTHKTIRHGVNRRVYTGPKIEPCVEVITPQLTKSTSHQ